MANLTNGKVYKILSIDAWGSPEGWDWNDLHKVGTIDQETLDKLVNDAVLIDWMVIEGFLNGSACPENVRVDGDTGGEGVCIVFHDKATDEPLYAISGIH